MFTWAVIFTISISVYAQKGKLVMLKFFNAYGNHTALNNEL